MLSIQRVDTGELLADGEESEEETRMATNYTMPMPTRAARPRVSRIARRPRAAQVRPDEGGQRSISELDEAHRRMKRNMRALQALLHLDAEGAESADAETLLTEVESRLQAMALGLRTHCRVGNFDQIELAVYLRQATRLWNTPPGHPPDGGWSFDASRSLVWQCLGDARTDRGPAAIATTDLSTALESVPPGLREVARRALYSCAVTFPPWFFNWRSPDALAHPGPRPSSELGVRLQTAPDGVKVAVSLSGVGPGLPAHFGETHQRTLARDLASLLRRLVREGRGVESDSSVEFEVSFASCRSLARSAAA